VRAAFSRFRTDARSRSLSEGFFDAVMSVDSFICDGTGDLYLNYLARFIKPAVRWASPWPVS
jgi:hypothetical protein